MSSAAIRGPINGTGVSTGISKRHPWVMFKITLPLDLRDIVRDQVPPGGTLISTIQDLLLEAVEARARKDDEVAAKRLRAAP